MSPSENRIAEVLSTGAGKKRVVGLLLFVAILALFFAFNRFPKIDTIDGDLDAVTGETIQCFQGFCIEKDPNEPFIDRVVDFSVIYIEAVAIGMTFAFLVAGMMESFFFPPGSAGLMFGGTGLQRTVKGMAIGPIMNLCAACIVPISASIHRRGGGIEGAIAAVQSSATMNFLAIGMVLVVFAPALGISRVVLAFIGAMVLGRIVAIAVGRGGESEPEVPESPVDPDTDPAAHTWKVAMREAFRDWARGSIAFQLRLWPIMIAAGFASALAIQLLDESFVSIYLGNNVQGVLIAATFGILVNVPLLFEIPLVAVLLILGMGTAPAATLLFAVAAGGPVTFWGLAKFLPRRAIATFATATWGLGVAGGLAVLVLGALFWPGSSPVHLTGPTGLDVATAREDLGREPPTFREVAVEAGVAFQHTRDDGFFNLGGGAAAADFNNDGWIDLYVTNSAGPNALYRNDGQGRFTDIAQQAGVLDADGRGHGVAWGDFDNDGLVDLYVANWGSSKLFRNNGDETFSDTTAAAGVADPDPGSRTTGAVWGDFDQDGLLDLLIVRHLDAVGPLFTINNTAATVLLRQCRTDEFYANSVVPRGVIIGNSHDYSYVPRNFDEGVRSLKLYRNIGDGTFDDVTSLLGDGQGYPNKVEGAGFKPAFVDYDEDGDLDIFVINDYGYEVYPNVLWRNDGPSDGGEWSFEDVSDASGINNPLMFGMGLAAGDYDNDSDLDFYVTDIGSSRFFENRTGLFEDVTELTGTGRGVIPENGEANRSIGWGATFADFDNDGWLDLYMTNGQIDSDPCSNLPYQPNALFVNRGDGSFADVSPASGADDPGTSREGVVADFNGDGALDIYVVNMGGLDGKPGISRLFVNSDRSTGHWLQVQPTSGDDTLLTVGARVEVTVGGTTMVQHVGLAQGHMSQSLVPVHFGLGEADSIDLVKVYWPSGTVQSLEDVEIDQLLAIEEPR